MARPCLLCHGSCETMWTRDVKQVWQVSLPHSHCTSRDDPCMYCFAICRAIKLVVPPGVGCVITRDKLGCDMSYSVFTKLQMLWKHSTLVNNKQTIISCITHFNHMYNCII